MVHSEPPGTLKSGKLLDMHGQSDIPCRPAPSLLTSDVSPSIRLAAPCPTHRLVTLLPTPTKENHYRHHQHTTTCSRNAVRTAAGSARCNTPPSHIPCTQTAGASASSRNTNNECCCTPAAAAHVCFLAKDARGCPCPQLHVSPSRVASIC